MNMSVFETREVGLLRNTRKQCIAGYKDLDGGNVKMGKKYHSRQDVARNEASTLTFFRTMKTTGGSLQRVLGYFLPSGGLSMLVAGWPC